MSFWDVVWFIIISFAQRTVLIGGTRYAGEMKKSIFSVLNYLLPMQGVLSMHCSANVGTRGDCALFFGLSGTGKTTLSADPERRLIGDDEHGWSDDGIFNFEGGCYAKVIKLSPEGEPEIYATTQMFGTVLENVDVHPETGAVDFNSQRITENTRASYPIHYIPNHVPEGMAGHPEHIVFLTADAFGVMPPIARLSRDQAMYHFLSGYTAKVAGTERGVTEPKETFSACFGAPFLPLPPTVYAQMLGERIAKHNVVCWLVNTGWTGGPYVTPTLAGSRPGGAVAAAWAVTRWFGQDGYTKLHVELRRTTERYMAGVRAAAEPLAAAGHEGVGGGHAAVQQRGDVQPCRVLHVDVEVWCACGGRLVVGALSVRERSNRGG